MKIYTLVTDTQDGTYDDHFLREAERDAEIKRFVDDHWPEDWGEQPADIFGALDRVLYADMLELDTIQYGELEISAKHHRGDRLELIADAIAAMKYSRDLLRKAQAPRAADYVARALKSAEGAERHARRVEG